MITLENIRRSLYKAQGPRVTPDSIHMNRATFDYLKQEYASLQQAVKNTYFGFPLIIDQTIPTGQFRWGFTP